MTLSLTLDHAGPVFLSTDRHGETATSSDTHRRVDAEVTRMLREAYSRVTHLLVSAKIFLYMPLCYLTTSIILHACSPSVQSNDISNDLDCGMSCMRRLAVHPLRFAAQGNESSHTWSQIPTITFWLPCGCCNCTLLPVRSLSKLLHVLQTTREGDLHTLARALLEHETLTRDDIQQVLDGTFTKVPVAREAAEAEVAALVAGHALDASDSSHQH